MRHIDNFIEQYTTDEPERYAAFFFALHRFPAMLQNKFETELAKYPLFCYYTGRPWRVVGCSRMGDVWLRELSSTKTNGYDARVAVDDCTLWSAVLQENPNV